MSWYCYAILVVSTLATEGIAQARQAEVRSFDQAAHDFKLLEPGSTPADDAPVIDMDLSSNSKLEHEFALFGADGQKQRAPDIVGNLVIPDWMKKPVGIAVTSPTPERPAGLMSSWGCGVLRYSPHPALNVSQEFRRRRYFKDMAAAACRAGVPVKLFDALIIQESRYNPNAFSSKGASGLTQLMPATARSLGVFDRWDVSQNLHGGARYLRKQFDAFGDWALALGAYNAGPGNVTKYGGIPPFRETREYVRSILASINSYHSSHRSSIGSTLQPGRSVVLASFTR